MSKQSRDDLKIMTGLDRFYTNTTSSTGDTAAAGVGVGRGFPMTQSLVQAGRKQSVGQYERAGCVQRAGRTAVWGKGGVMPHAHCAVWVRIQVGGPSQGVAVDKFLLHQGDAYLSTDG